MSAIIKHIELTRLRKLILLSAKLRHKVILKKQWNVLKRPSAELRQNTMTSSNGNIFRVTGLCAGKSPGTGEFPARRPVTRSFDVFFDLRPNEQLSKQSWGWWFETPSHSLWRHCNAVVHAMLYSITHRISRRFSSNVLFLSCLPRRFIQPRKIHPLQYMNIPTLWNFVWALWLFYAFDIHRNIIVSLWL